MQAALSLLDIERDQQGRVIGHVIVVGALCRHLVSVIPRLDYCTRVALLEASWAYSRVPELRCVPMTILETWPGRFPSTLGLALHRLRDEVFTRLPKAIRWKCCTVVPARFRKVLAALIGRWFSSVGPSVSTCLLLGSRTRPSKGGSSVRRSIDPSLYVVLHELVGHDNGALLASFSLLIWRGVKFDCCHHRSSLYPVLFTDVVLGLRAHSAGTLRRLALVLDTVAVNGVWDDASVARLRSVLRPTIRAKTTNSDYSQTGKPCGSLQDALEAGWRQLGMADSAGLFTSPVSDATVLVCVH
mmetsp:Transcript_27692/g.85604  ORF Transcript_27692/g.85604 Transcript_27692/m.85604 type:complete len:300 (-) Transcript_27692:1111-2010(-)